MRQIIGRPSVGDMNLLEKIFYIWIIFWVLQQQQNQQQTCKHDLANLTQREKENPSRQNICFFFLETDDDDNQSMRK